MSTNSQRCLVHQFTVTARVCDDPVPTPPIEPFPPLPDPLPEPTP